MTTAEAKRILAAAKKYGLAAQSPDMSDPKVVEQITAEVIEECRDDLEAADAAEQASRAAAWKIRVVN